MAIHSSVSESATPLTIIGIIFNYIQKTGSGIQTIPSMSLISYYRLYKSQLKSERLPLLTTKSL